MRWIIALVACLLYTSGVQAQSVQQSVITWASVENQNPFMLAMPFAMMKPAQILKEYVVLRGLGEVCGQASVPLTMVVGVIPRATPVLTPTRFVDTSYPDQNGLACWEILTRFEDGSESPRSTRLFKEIVSTRQTIDEPRVE